MKNSKVLKIVLLLSGLIGAGVGGAILFMPVAFYADYGIDLGGQVSLLNEVRAPGGALLAVGLFVMVGAFVSRLTFAATVLSVLLYLSYGLSRLFSFVADGMPAEGLVQATAVELVVGLVCVFALIKYREA